MAKDPICGMTVDESTSLCAERDGQTFYFCCEHCRQKFLAPAAHVHHQTTEKHLAAAPEAHFIKPSQSLPLKLAPSPETKSCCANGTTTEVKPSATAKYFCPMCDGVVSDKPGDCPKCGMALEKNPAWKPKSKVIYTCPMHPEIEQDHPGEKIPVDGIVVEGRSKGLK